MKCDLLSIPHKGRSNPIKPGLFCQLSWGEGGGWAEIGQLTSSAKIEETSI